MKAKNFPVLLPAILLMSVVHVLPASSAPTFSSSATLSRRAAKPGEPVELVVTVRGATHPSVIVPSPVDGIAIRLLRKPQYFVVEGEGVWLFRYKAKPLRIGDFEISPIQVVDGLSTRATKPLLLHVSPKGELPPLSAKELALGVDIPPSLSQEILKAAPQPTPMPTPSPTPRDTRGLGVRAAGSCWHALKAFWNYPGK